MASIEGGSQPSYNLSISIALFSSGFACLIALLTTEINSQYTLFALIYFTVCSGIVGVVLLLLWFKDRNAIGSVITKIKERNLRPPNNTPTSSVTDNQHVDNRPPRDK